jgi:competence protein ComEC
VYDVTRYSSYGSVLGVEGHPPLVLADVVMVGLAVVVAVSAVVGDVRAAALVALAIAIPFRSWPVFVIAVLLAFSGSLRAADARHGLEPDVLGPFTGWVRLVDDPQPYASSTRVIADVGGERFEVWSRGRAQQLRVRTWRGGQWVAVSGTRLPLDAERAGRVAWQHVVGEFELDWASDVDEGGPIDRASNRVRRAIERSAESLPSDDGALFRGLVVGDDRDQPREMIVRFRASGLSHLTAVSGQNVAFVLAATGPLLRRLRRWPRLLLTVGLIAWFVALTRFEPSIVRAGSMAVLSALAYATGRERAPLRILSLAVIGLVLIDPLIVRSIGFWLSVGATAGVSTVGPWLARRFRRLGFLALPVGITLGAQVGVLIPSVLVFGRLPLVSVPANLLAVPVAGAVMLYGLPAGLLAGWIPVLAQPLMLPARFGTRWVDTIAMLGERIEPAPPWPWVGWGVVATICVVVVAVGARRGKNQALHGDTSPDR